MFATQRASWAGPDRVRSAQNAAPATTSSSAASSHGHTKEITTG